MSSFVCSANHFNEVEEALRKLILNKDMFSVGYDVKQYFPEFFDSRFYTREQTEMTLMAIMTEIRKLNVLTVNIQYSDDGTVLNKKDIEAGYKEVLKKTPIETLSNVALYKALSCIAYQIEWHQITNNRPLTELEEGVRVFLKTIINDVADWIVYNLPEYNEAKWTR